MSMINNKNINREIEYINLMQLFGYKSINYKFFLDLKSSFINFVNNNHDIQGFRFNTNDEFESHFLGYNELALDYFGNKTKEEKEHEIINSYKKFREQTISDLKKKIKIMEGFNHYD